jgi:nicastrin
MLMAFDALVKMPNPEALDKEIIFLFFPGEDFGYLGSSRFLWDLARPYACAQDGDAKNQLACRKPYLPTKEYRKLRPDRFAFLLDVSQVAHVDSPGLFVHSAHANKNTSALAEALRQQGATVVPPGLKRGIPPSPLVSFLAHPDVPADTGAAVLAGYRDTFPGTAYASPDDTAGAVSLARMTEAAGVIASALWALAGGDGSVAPDPQLAGTLLGCLTADFQCDLVRGLFPGGGKPPKTTAWYVGAFQHRYEPGTPEQRFVYRFLAERSAVASAGNCTAPSDCDYRQKGLTCVRGTCMRTAAYMHQGFSPAVEWDYTDNRWVMNQTLADRYGTTVESDWPAAIGVRVLQEDDGRHAPGHAAAGLATTALAAAAWLLAAPYLSAKFKLD